MQPNERYDIIMQKLATQEMVTISELVQMFGVSVETLRRDLNYLERKQYIKKVYGGAILFNRPASIVDYNLRMEENLAEKEAIGRKCAELINDGDTIFLGPGATVLQVARNLKEHKRLTVVTTSMFAALELRKTDAKIFFIGGYIDNDGACTSQIIPGESVWEQFYPPKAIIGAGGISISRGITDFSVSDGLALGQIVRRAASVYVVADNSKFGLVHSCTTCPLSSVNYIITGYRAKEDILASYSTYKQRFLFADGYTTDLSADSGVAMSVF